MTEPLSVGVVGIVGGWSSEALADAMYERTGKRLLIEMSKVVVDLKQGRVLFGDVDLCRLDGLIIKKVGESYGPTMIDRLEILRYVADRGVRVFSRPLSILRLLDRLACTVTLASAGVPMPETAVTEDVDRAVEIIRRFGTAVLKPLYSTKARGMLVVDGSEPDLPSRVERFKRDDNPVIYVQRRLTMPDRDYGVVFIGGKHVGTYARVRARDAWNTTIRAGGHYERHEPTVEVVEVAERAQALFDLDFTSVDVVDSPEGPLVFEVSAFGGFRGSKEGLGIDPASRYADYVLDCLTRG